MYAHSSSIEKKPSTSTDEERNAEENLERKTALGEANETADEPFRSPKSPITEAGTSYFALLNPVGNIVFGLSSFSSSLG